MDDGVVGIPLPIQFERESTGPDEKQGDRKTVESSSRTFFVGPENRLVEVVVRSVLGETTFQDAPSPKTLSAKTLSAKTTAPSYNPIVLFGSPGTGKSHLAMGLAGVYRQHHPRRKITVGNGVDFARELIDAIDSQATGDFRHRWRKTRLIVLDDVTRLAGKEMAQQELIQTIDHALRAKTPVLVTAATAPSRWTDMLPALQSRFTAGLVVPLLPPRRATRLAILHKLLADRDLELKDGLLEMLAEGIRQGARELAGGITRLMVGLETEGTPIDRQAVRTLLAEYRDSSEITIDAIAKATARAWSIRLAQLKSKSRRREVVLARNTAMYLTRQWTDHSLERVGSYFGGRDHTTVQHGCRKIAELLKRDPTIEEAMDRIQILLLGG